VFTAPAIPIVPVVGPVGDRGARVRLVGSLALFGVAAAEVVFR
jgi:hypothetical protein